MAERRLWEKVAGVLEAAAPRARGDRRRRVGELGAYLRANWAGIMGHPEAWRLGLQRAECTTWWRGG